MSGRRLQTGGLVDRTKELRFTFNGKTMTGYAGDTVASALIANGVDIVARSFKYHRPRGFFGAGCEDPSAMLAVRDQYGFDAAIRAAEVYLTEGMDVRTSRGFPSAAFDLGVLIQPFARFIKAGFYYKTFKWPNWRWFEPVIKRTTGFGDIDPTASPRPAERVHARCGVLVIGGGAAGLSAADTLIDAGHDVLIVDEGRSLGGAALWSGQRMDDKDAAAWINARVERISGADNIRVLTDTVVTGAYEGNFFTLLQSISDDGGVRLLRHIKLKAEKVILATGAVERPLVFPGNDLPGVMLASAACRYIGQFGVAPMSCLAVFVNNDAGYRSAIAAHRAGIDVAAVIDVRDTPAQTLLDEMSAIRVPVMTGLEVAAAIGERHVRAVDVRPLAGGRTVRVACDGLAVSGGETPLVHLAAHRGMKPVYDPESASFVPSNLPDGWVGAGAVTGPLKLDEAVRSGDAAARLVVGEEDPTQAKSANPYNIQPHWRATTGDPAKMFVDHQHDVTVADIELAAREGYVSVEHLKRYTTLGMGTDQGRTSNINGLAILAGLTGREIVDVGTTTFRPPYTAVPMAAIAGNRVKTFYRAARYLPAHETHENAGAVFEDVGWMRPDWYRMNGEDREAAVATEMAAVRSAVGLFDGSPLGKIEVAGPDARAFVDRFYVSNIMTLKPGRIRYSVMLHEDGVIFDDGVVTCVDDNLFIVGPSSGNADTVAAWLERWRQTEWPGMRVAVAPVTSNWASIAIAGPKAREVLAALDPDFSISGDVFSHMSYRQGRIAGFDGRVSRVSFTGELQYEVNVPARHGKTLLTRLLNITQPMGGRLVGLEAWLRLRLEKGYLHVGADTNGRTTPLDIGMGGVAAKKPGDFIGKRSLALSYAQSENREQLVGLTVKAGALRVGGRILMDEVATPPCPTAGYVTSACYSPSLGYYVGLALIENGANRMGETIKIFDRGQVLAAEICRPGPFDPDNERLMA
ncbi:MAG: (2Fe-2S)-binding protein [Rhodospirillales bacterium]|nr:(2Fe-2S)-binding protein [Rhodospirillales bacterium]